MKDYRFEFYETLGSTNDEIKKRADNDEDEGLVVISNAQTAGRGRMGRKFLSPEGSGLYFSLLLRPGFGAETAALITPAAAVAVCRGIESLRETVGFGRPVIKWVNDVYTEEGKVCGILTEAAADYSSGLKYAVLGIGINISPPPGGFPEEINAAGLLPADSCEDGIGAGGCGTEGSRTGNPGGKKAEPGEIKSLLLEAVLGEFRKIYEKLENDPGDRSFLEYYRGRNMVTGKKVRLVSGAEIAKGREEGGMEGTAIGIDDECRLIVRLSDGKQVKVDRGEVVIL